MTGSGGVSGLAERTLRIAMWSGPRNISTALMRAWENRPDTFVTDEPLYACYLLRTGAPHPGREEVIRSQDTDWRRVTAWLTGPTPGGRAIWYQKHMAHHLLPEIERDWLASLTNCFLIRDPREMLPSLARFLPDPTLADTGLPQQLELFRREWERTGRVPPVLDARDVLLDPRGMLERLCREVGAPFREEMLAWPPGPRPTDGVWGRYWYAAVERSTGFEPYRPKEEPVPHRLAGLLADCEAIYRELHRHRLRPAQGRGEPDATARDARAM